MAIKLKKTLYVGLGGTGVATLLKIKKCFIDCYGVIPPMIGFLAIDTDGAANSKSVTSNRGKEIRLDQNELLVCTVPGALNVYNASPKTYDWVPTKNVSKLATIQGFGAGQVRSNGRFIAYYNNKRIKDNIQAVVSRINQLIPHGSSFEIDTNRNGIEYPANINVIASIAGGTGSGMLVDVLCLIREALKQQGVSFNLYPWIVLPEVFKAMNQGPAMHNVLYNSYGALRTLDYIEHYDPKTPALNFGYARVNEPLFNYAYIINNTNQAGVSFNNLNDISDVIAKSAFLPANKMGDDLQSPFDNIVAQKMGGTYDIRNKKAWAASVGSAELIYDSQAVGRSYAYRIISQLCDSMLQSPIDGSADANKFFDDQNVMIRENNGRDDVIDSLMSPVPIYSLEITEDTTEQNINFYLDQNYGQTVVEPELKANLDDKLKNTKQQFEKYIADIMTRPQGKVDSAVRFIESLQKIVDLCKGEMEKEAEELRILNSQPEQWGAFLNGAKNKGIKSLVSKTNQEGIEILQNRLQTVVTNHREEIRRQWALKFYVSFEEILSKKLQDLNALKNILSNLAKDNSNSLIQEQYLAQSTSKFQLFLHQSDVNQVSSYNVDDSVKTALVQYLVNGASKWLGMTSEAIQKELWDFAKTVPEVKAAVNKTIDEALSEMSVDRVKSYLDSLKVLASPLWTYNTQGYNDQALALDKFVIVGVGNRDTSVLSTNDAFNTYFDTNGNKTSFATTNQDDRVYVLVVEDLLPIYAVNNFNAYRQDSDQKVATNFMMSNYLDEKLHNRMNSENFDMLPVIETDDVLQYWVWGFVFGYIHFDADTNQYWMRSKKRGDALDKYRFNLSHQRDVAYDMFKSEGLYKEIEAALDLQIAKTGRDPIDAKISEIKMEESYLESYAQLSPLEASNLKDPKFKAVADLVKLEIGLMTE